MMPAPGDQHRPTPATTNPFEESIPRINIYTAQEIVTLSNKLERQLGPEYISTRPGAGGGKVHYLAAEKVINLANEVFGFNGWSSQIQNVQVDFVDENQTTGKITLGLSIICRVTLKDGTFHEDIGYGHIENCKGKAAAFEKAKKEAATDALKRALRNFGKVLGNCLYDKDYLQRVSKVKVGPARWDVANLHRHPDYVVEKRPAAPEVIDETLITANEEGESNLLEHEDEFGGDIFDGVELKEDHPDEVVLHSRNESEQALREQGRLQAPQFNGPAGSHNLRPKTRSYSANAMTDTSMAPPASVPIHSTSAQSNSMTANRNAKSPSSAQVSTLSTPAPSGHAPEPVVGFVTSRAAGLLAAQEPPNANILASLPRFNLNSESPSIRRTNGINHATSAPISRNIVNGGDLSHPVSENTLTSDNPSSARTVNFTSPAGEVSRRIGMPGGGVPSPLTNRNAYKPPAQVKRPITHTDGVTVMRTPLTEVTNINGTPIQLDAAGKELKRPRMAER